MCSSFLRLNFLVPSILTVASLFAALPSADARSADAAAPPLVIPLLIPADDVRQGFARIINHSDRAGTVRIYGTDDGGRVHGPVTLFVNAEAAREFSARDLEAGNASKGLSGYLGDGEGSWRLRLESDLDIEAGAYIRTPDGFVASVHDIARTVVIEGETVHRVPIFEPGSNRDQVSLLRLVNLTDAMVDVTIEGRDDEGEPAPGGEVRLTLPAGGARYLSAPQLESGGAGLTGHLGDGTGRWQLSVTADGDIDVVSLLQSPAGHLANLSMSLRTVSAVGSTAYAAGPAWAARHNLTSSQYQDASASYVREGYRPVAVSGYAVGSEARFAAVWSKEAGPAWAARHNLSSSQYQSVFTTYVQQGYRPVAVSGYAVGGEARFAAVWSKEAGPAWAARHNLTSSQYQDASASYVREGYRPVAVSGYAVGGEARFAAVWSKEAGPAWAARHNLTSSQYQDASASYVREGYRPVAVSGYAVGGEARFAAVWSKEAGPAWTARHNLTSSQYQDASASYVREGYRPVAVSGYAVGGEARFAAIWSKTGEPVGTVRHTIPLFLAAGYARQGFARIINHSDRAGTVRIVGTDDAGRVRGPVILDLDPGATRHFDSDDLEEGNAFNGLLGSLGDGTGDWRLELTTSLDIEPSAYVRTSDGLLAPMHAVARTVETGGATVHQVPIFNSGSNRHEASWLRVANLTDDDVLVTIRERDDAGEEREDVAQTTEIREVRLVLPGRAARRFSAQQLESGDSPELSGRLVGTGKRRLFVTADGLVTAGGAIEVMSLVQSPTGHLSNLSTMVHRGFEVVAGGPATVRPLETIHLAVPGGLGDSDYTVLMDLSGTGEFPEDDTVEVDGLTTDDDRILFASPLTQVLPEANTSHRLVVRVRREADQATSNVLRYSIDDITSVAGPPGFATLVFEAIQKSIYASVDDPLLNLKAASIQPGLVAWSASRLGVDLTFSDVLAEATMQSLLGMPVTELAPAPVAPVPAPVAPAAAASPSAYSASQVPTAPANAGSGEDAPSQRCRALEFVSSTGKYGICKTVEDAIRTGQSYRPKDCLGGGGLFDFDEECYYEDKKNHYKTQVNVVGVVFDGISDAITKAPLKIFAGAAVTRFLSNWGVGKLGNKAVKKGVVNPAIKELIDGRSVENSAEVGVEAGRVHKTSDDDEEIKKRIENHKLFNAFLLYHLQKRKELVPKVEKEVAAAPHPDDDKRELYSVLMNDFDRGLREAETLDDQEAFRRGEKKLGEAIGNDPNRGMATAANCKLGYREFPLKDGKTSTCVFESLVEENCYRGSRQPIDVDLGGSEACLYFSLDYHQPDGSCRENYADVNFQGQRTCRWADLGSDQSHWYTLHKALDDEQPEEPEEPEQPETGIEFCPHIRNAYNNPDFADIPLEQKKRACRQSYCRFWEEACDCCDTLGSALPSRRVSIDTFQFIEPAGCKVTGYGIRNTLTSKVIEVSGFDIPQDAEACTLAVKSARLTCEQAIFHPAGESINQTCPATAAVQQERQRCWNHFTAELAKCGPTSN